MAGKSTLIATTSNWEYIDVELILTASAGQTSAYVTSIWGFTKGTKTGTAGRKYYLYVANKDKIRSVSSLADIKEYQNGCSGVSSSNLGSDHVNWKNGNVPIKASTTSSKIKFAIALVSANAAENTERFGVSLGKNKHIYDYRRDDDQDSNLDPETGLPPIIEKCIAYDEIEIDNPYWTYTEPSSAINHTVYAGHVPSSVSGVIGSDNSTASSIRRTQGGISFKDGTKYSIANGTLRVGKYEFCAFAPFDEEYLGWVFYDDSNTQGYHYTDNGNSSSYEWNGTGTHSFFMKKTSGTITNPNCATWFAVAFKPSSSGQVTITFDKNKPESASGTVQNMPSNMSGDLTSDPGYITIPSTIPRLEGYVFLGWTLNDYSKHPFIKTGQTYKYARRRNITLYAIWVPQISIYYYKNDGTSNQYSFSPEEKTYNEVYDIHAATTRTDYNFVNWNTASDGGGDSYGPGDEYTENENLSLYAQWALGYKKIWLYNGSSWKQGIPWVYTGSEWKKGKSAWIYNGTAWKEEK